MGNPIRILVVDDETTDRHLFRVTLEKGLDEVAIVEADNWASLTDVLDHSSFDIILTDYKLKGFNGLDVIDEVRRRAIDIPIIMVSGTGTEEIAIEAMRRGVHDYVLKSFKHIKRLPAMVLSLVENVSTEFSKEIEKTDPQRYIGAFENAPYGVVLIDDHSIIVQANRAISEILGISAEKLIGKEIITITHPDDIDATLKFHYRLFSGEIENYEQQKRYLHHENYAVWTEESSSIICDDQQQCRYAVLQVKDISERKRADEILDNIARGVSAATGQEFFRSLTQHLAEALDTDYAFVCELVDDRSNAIKSVAAFGHGQFLDPMEHAVDGTPFQDILNNGTQSHRSNVQQAYSSPLLVKLGAECLVGAPLFDSEGLPLGIIVVIHSKPLENIEFAESMLKIFSVRASAELERQRSATALEDSEKRYRTLYDENPSMFFTVNDEGKLLSVNKYGAAQLGYSVKDLVGRCLSDIVFEHDRHAEAHHLSRCFDQPQSVQRWEQRLTREDGTILWVRQSARRVINTDNISSVLIVSEDISEAQKLSDQLSYQAIHDPLTDLLNRREFENRLKAVLDSVALEERDHALCYIDLDQFKVINDSCGHVAGDELLRQLSLLLRGVVIKRDTLARLGGDEFGIIVEDCALDQSIRVARELLQAIREFHFIWEDKRFNIGASIGVVPIGPGSGNVANVLKEADAACYVAKDKGRNRIHVYRENDLDLAERHGEILWVGKIHQGLQENRFRLYYQEIIPTTGLQNNGIHFELLIRMVSEEGALVAPGAFLPAAERYNLSPRIDRWVIQTAFEYLAAHPQTTQDLSLCSINLSGLSLTGDDLLGFIIGLIEQSGIPADKICFEITETAAIANLSSAIHFMKTLKDLGCQFALDDFGSGLSSFAYLKSLPVDYLKIDGVFVRGIATDPIDLAMVKSINEIGHVMGKRTVAEFVENEAILVKLKEIGVDYGQGYHIGMPKPFHELQQDIANSMANSCVNH